MRVATGFYPLQFVTERVGGDLVSVDNLTVPGREPHDLDAHHQGDRRRRPVPTSWSSSTASSRPSTQRSRTAPRVRCSTRPRWSSCGTRTRPSTRRARRTTTTAAWTRTSGRTPLLLADLGDAVADSLAEIDEDHAEQYAANAADLRADLEELDASYVAGLTGCERDTVVVSHDAFGYLEKYGLHFEAIAGLSPDAEPTPADLGRLQLLIEDEGITTVFGERLAPPALVDTLASDAGVSAEVLDPIEGLTDDNEDEDYLTLMAENLDALRTANGCP